MTMASKIIGSSTADRTEFQLHISQFQSYVAGQKTLHDFTEEKLQRYLCSIIDNEKRTIVIAVLHDYCAGKIAVAWRAGEPVYVQMNKMK